MFQKDGFKAVFKIGLHNGESIETRTAVEFWTEDDDKGPVGWILDDSGDMVGVFRRCDELNNFLRYDKDEQEVGQVIPAAPGWWCVDKCDTGKALWDRVIAWSISNNGWTVRAIINPGNCNDLEPQDTSNTKQFVFNPDVKEEGVGIWPFEEEEEEAQEEHAPLF